MIARVSLACNNQPTAHATTRQQTIKMATFTVTVATSAIDYLHTHAHDPDDNASHACSPSWQQQMPGLLDDAIDTMSSPAPVLNVIGARSSTQHQRRTRILTHRHGRDPMLVRANNIDEPFAETRQRPQPDNEIVARRTKVILTVTFMRR